jgi:hypothetical protein
VNHAPPKFRAFTRDGSFAVLANGRTVQVLQVRGALSGAGGLSIESREARELLDVLGQALAAAGAVVEDAPDGEAMARAMGHDPGPERAPNPLDELAGKPSHMPSADGRFEAFVDGVEQERQRVKHAREGIHFSRPPRAMALCSAFVGSMIFRRWTGDAEAFRGFATSGLACPDCAELFDSVLDAQEAP